MFWGDESKHQYFVIIFGTDTQKEPKEVRPGRMSSLYFDRWGMVVDVGTSLWVGRRTGTKIVTPGVQGFGSRLGPGRGRGGFSETLRGRQSN